MTAVSVMQHKEDTMSEINEAMVEKMIEGAGYRELTVELMPGRGEFVATAIKRVGATPYKAQAIGRTQRDAANALVRVITRP